VLETNSGIPYPGPYIIVFGDSDFIANANFYSANNADLFLRLVSYLGAGSEVVTIPNKNLAQRMLILTPERGISLIFPVLPCYRH